jgi:hypothetical protein
LRATISNFLTANIAGLESMQASDSAFGYHVNRVADVLNGHNPIPLIIGSLTIQNGLIVSAGGAAITGNSAVTGNLNVTGTFTPGGAIVGPIIINPGDLTITAGNLKFGAASAKIIPGATNLSFRNNADSADNLLITDAGAAIFRADVDATTFEATGAASLGSPVSGRFVGAWSTTGAPTGLTAELDDFGFDGGQVMWICTVAGTPGTWAAIRDRVSLLSANSATPAINTNTTDVVHITSQTAAITSFTTNLSGTPIDGQRLRISVTGTAAVALTWGTSFEASTVALPTTTATTARLDIGFFWNTETSKWRCMAVA